MLWKHSFYRRAERIIRERTIKPWWSSLYPSGPCYSSNLAWQRKQIQNQIQYNKCESITIRMQLRKTQKSLKWLLTSTAYLILTNAWVTLLAGSFHWPAFVDSLRTERKRQLTVLAQNRQFSNSNHQKRLPWWDGSPEATSKQRSSLRRSLIQGRSALQSPSKKWKEHRKGEQNKIMAGRQEAEGIEEPRSS